MKKIFNKLKEPFNTAILLSIISIFLGLFYIIYFYIKKLISIRNDSIK
jgi:hypothetical protein